MPSPWLRAFTLVELLTVIAVISLLIALVAPALGSGKAKNLTAGGNLVTDLASQAREESVARGSMVALVLLTGSTTHPDWNDRLFILVERSSGATKWTPVTAWTSLPTGVRVDDANSTTFTDSAHRPSVSALDLPPYSGTTVTDDQCAYQIFLPGGGLAPNSADPTTPPRLRFVPTASGTSTHDFYDLTLNRYTGIPKADRP